jgi:predicted transcriptional regulator
MSDRHANAFRAGPRNVLALDSIRRPVVRALASVGMSGELIADLLGVKSSDVYGPATSVTGDDVARRIDEEARTAPESGPDVVAALREWAARAEYRENGMCKAYAEACGFTLDDFVHPRREDCLEENLAFRVNHEILQALSLWLAIGGFERRSGERSDFCECLLRIVCEDDESDRGLAGLVQLAFQAKLHIPFDLAHDLWKETIRVACERGIPSPFDGGSLLSRYLSSVEHEIVRRQIRPFAAPMWPSGTGDHIRAILRSREWEGHEAAEVHWLCDGVMLHRAATVAFEPMRQALGRKDAETAERLRPGVVAAQDAAIKMSRALSSDHNIRCVAHQRIAAWLAETHPDLIELVRPCGNPLGATW